VPIPATPPSTPKGGIGPAGAALEATSFDIAVRAPPENEALRALVDKHVNLQRYRAITDLDETELTRLTVLAEQDVRNLAGTLGYFSPEIAITRENAPTGRLTIVISIQPGDATVVGPVSIDFTGDIAQSKEADAISQRATIQREWRLPAGRVFTQDGWSTAKNQALRTLLARRYPAGRVSESLADIDAPDRTAGLSVKLDSGPVYRLGKMQVTGIERYDPVLVPRLARLDEGTVYDQNQLVQAQQRLASSGYFDSAYVFIDPDSDPAATPVQVQVREARLQKVTLGVGVTTDSGPRASAEYTHQRVPGIGWRAATKLQLERRSPFAQTEWISIPNESRWRWVALGRVERLDDNELVTQAQRLRFGRTQTGDRIDRSMYLQYDRASVSGPGVVNNSAAQTGDGSALSGNYVWTGRYFDNLPFPGNGYGLGFELGGGTTLGQDRQPFVRTVGRWLGIKGLSAGNGRLAMRAEGGAVLANGSANLPSGQLFRTGGDTTVRGYDLRDIGVPLANGGVGPGRYLAVGSVEWQRPIKQNGVPGDFENTLFVDAGAVADSPGDLRPSVGVGTGVRWRSPIGPLAASVAYGIKARQVRFHLSVGFAF
jgi:translocation and assembly module TamA